MPFQEMIEEFGYAHTKFPKSGAVGGFAMKVFEGLVAVGNCLTDTGDGILEGVGYFTKWAYDHFILVF